MDTSYKQLNLEDRVYIETRRELSASISSIAKDLKRARKTISEELNRNSNEQGIYLAKYAQQQSDLRRRTAKKANKYDQFNPSFYRFWLRQGWSLEQINGRFLQERNEFILATSTLYRMIDSAQFCDENLRVLLPRKGKPYKQKPSHEAGCRLIPDRIDIDERPEEVDLKEELGHWEGDTVKGADGYFVTMAERKSKAFFFIKVKSKTKHAVSQALIRLMKPMRHQVKTITFDNGGEFADHGRIAKALKCNIYFAKPYQSWQRGLNENSNGLLRRYFPKGAKIWHVTHQQLQELQTRINLRPRKSLGYKMPFEVLTGECVTVMSGM